MDRQTQAVDLVEQCAATAVKLDLPEERQFRVGRQDLPGEVFAEIRPATTIVEVARLIDAHAMIEIEADAIVT